MDRDGGPKWRRRLSRARCGGSERSDSGRAELHDPHLVLYIHLIRRGAALGTSGAPGHRRLHCAQSLTNMQSLSPAYLSATLVVLGHHAMSYKKSLSATGLHKTIFETTSSEVLRLAKIEGRLEVPNLIEQSDERPGDLYVKRTDGNDGSPSAQPTT